MFGIEEATEAQTASPIGSSNNVVEVFITHILIRAETNMKPPTNFAPLLPTRTSICNARRLCNPDASIPRAKIKPPINK